MKSAAGYLLFFILFLTMGAVWAAALYFYHPASVPVDEKKTVGKDGGKSEGQNALFPSCLFRKMTGIYCPGCGSTRASASLLRGDFKGSLRNHPLILPLIPVMIFLLFRFFYEGMSGREIPIPRWKEISVVGAIFLILFWILRNIPLACFDLLRPPS